MNSSQLSNSVVEIWCPTHIFQNVASSWGTIQTRGACEFAIKNLLPASLHKSNSRNAPQYWQWQQSTQVKINVATYLSSHRHYETKRKV